MGHQIPLSRQNQGCRHRSTRPRLDKRGAALLHIHPVELGTLLSITAWEYDYLGGGSLSDLCLQVAKNEAELPSIRDPFLCCVIPFQAQFGVIRPRVIGS